MAKKSKELPWLWRPPKDGYIGRRGLRPKEASEKVSGRAVYTNDVYLPGMLYAKVYRSPYAHARIKSMDSSKAEVLPGVWAVIRYDDQDVDLKEHFLLQGLTWFWWRDLILPDTADSYGIRVGAMVVADSEEICDHALKLIGEGIAWEELPFILDPEEAAQSNAPLLHPELNPKSNVWQDIVIYNIGDTEKGFASSDNIIEFCEIKKEDDIWAGVEPGCIIAQWKGEELEIWYHGQYPTLDIESMGVPVFKGDASKLSRLIVHTPYNGGSFGGNAMGVTCQLCRYAVIAARKTNRPVKVVDDYAMSWEGVSYETGTAHYKVGFNNDGTIVAIRIDTYQKHGHPIVAKFKDTLKTPNIYVRQIRTYWSKAHESCWKDGATNCTFVNLIINKVAAHLGMDPIKVQVLNDGVEGHAMEWLDENVKKPLGMPVRDSLKEVIEAGKTAFEWDKKWHAPGTRRLPNGKMHGVAFYAVASWFVAPGTGEGPKGRTFTHKFFYPGISLSRDGKATVYFRRCDTGQSSPTAYCQIVADELGLRYEDVNIEFREFTGFEGLAPQNSQGTPANSIGLVLNARAMKKVILECALKPITDPMTTSFDPPEFKPSPFEGKTIEELDIRYGIIFEKANPGNTLAVSTVTASSVSLLMSLLFQRGPFFYGNMPPEVELPEHIYEMARQCCFIEVEVDTETGQVDIMKLVHPYDLGQSINPDINDGQLYGGAYQGLGVSSTEAIYYDPQTGVKLNDNLIGYPVLTILDVGPIESPIVETHLGFGAYGLYGCSEAGKAVPAAALLVPAVYNAIGQWIEETPITPDRVLKALGKA